MSVARWIWSTLMIARMVDDWKATAGSGIISEIYPDVIAGEMKLLDQVILFG